MKDLIEALQILALYSHNENNPTHCEHDEFTVYVNNPNEISTAHIARLNELSFHRNEYGGFYSFRFGSC